MRPNYSPIQILFGIILSLGLSAAATPLFAMTFQMQERCVLGLQPECQNMVLAVGAIDKDSAAQFKSYASHLPRGTWVAMSSPGGNLLGGMQLGMAIRELGFNATIGNTDHSPPDCLSACAYAFAGGLARRLSPGSRYGLHQFRGAETELSASTAQQLSTVLAKYLDGMGVDRRVLDIAQMTTSDKVTILSMAQARQYQVDNAGLSPYPRWRLEVMPDGKLLTVNHLVSQKAKLGITLAFIPANQGIACLIFYKSDDGQAFAEKIIHRMQIQGQSFTLQQANDWQLKTGGYQAVLIMSNSLLEALTRAPEDTVVTLSGEFNRPPNSVAAPVEAYFGVGNLKNTLNALSKK